MAMKIIQAFFLVVLPACDGLAPETNANKVAWGQTRQPQQLPPSKTRWDGRSLISSLRLRTASLHRSSTALFARKKRDNMIARRRAIGAFSLFGDLESEEEDLIAASLEEVFVANGEKIITQGAEGENAMFFVKYGTFDCIDDRANEGPFSWLPDKKVATLTEGAHFGELSLFLDEPRAVSVRASSEGGAVAWKLNGDVLDGLNISRVDDVLKLRKVLRGKYKSKATLDAFFRLVPQNEESVQLLDSALPVLRQYDKNEFSKQLNRLEDGVNLVVKNVDKSIHRVLFKVIKAELDPVQRRAYIVRILRSLGIALLSWLLLARLCTSCLIAAAWTRTSWAIPTTDRVPHRQIFFRSYTTLNMIFGPLFILVQVVGTPLIYEKYRRYFHFLESKFISRRTRSLYPLWAQTSVLAMGFATNLLIALVTSFAGIGLGTFVGHCKWR